jgi:hypothetical protein
VHGCYPTTALVALAAVAAGCGGQAASEVATTPPEKRTITRPDQIVLRGDYAPDSHGPLELDGRYTVRFTQRGAGVDFSREVPFTAHLERPTTGGPPPKIPLFKKASRSGSTTITVHGSYDVVIDFGDSPYAIVMRRS